jgi:hypothetical protein
VHFHYLLEGPDALLRSARTLDEHTDALAQTLAGRDSDPDRSARFVHRFVRPRGIEVPATAVFVDTVEAAAAGPAPAPMRVPAWTQVLRPMLVPFARAAAERVRRINEELRDQKKQILLEHRQRKAFLERR